jgi:hypothetical protein
VPQYFFHNDNGESLIDEVGIELPDEAAAKKEAICATSEVLHDLAKPSRPCHVTKCVLSMRAAMKSVALTVAGHSGRLGGRVQGWFAGDRIAEIR